MEEALHLHDRAPAPGKKVAAVMAVGMHVLLALFLIYGVRWQDDTSTAVEVELVSAVPVTAPRAPSPDPVKDPAPEPPKPAPTPVPKPQPKVEPPKPEVAKPTPKPPDIAVKEKEKEKPKPPTPAPDPLQEMLRKEAEQLQKQKSAAAASSAAAQELSQIKSAQAASASSKSKADYLSKIRGKVRGNIVLPPGLTGNPEVVFEVTQLPTGEVLSVKLRKSSSIPALDQAIERAIYKSSPLPLPERKELFDRLLILSWHLEDL